MPNMPREFMQNQVEEAKDRLRTLSPVEILDFTGDLGDYLEEMESMIEQKKRAGVRADDIMEFEETVRELLDSKKCIENGESVLIQN